MGASKLKIIYKDESFFIINKEAGWHSCALDKNTANEETLSSLVLEELGPKNPYLKEAKDAGLLQRLDYFSSGCLVGAFSKEAASYFKELLKKEELEKTYLVVCEGLLKEACEINFSIGHSNRRSKKVKVYSRRTTKKDRALSASSKLIPLARNTGLNLSLVSVSAKLARRHQVRAHSAYLGFPLLGDDLYGAERSFQDLSGLKRKFFLHAHTLDFTHFSKNTRIRAEAKVTKEERIFLNRLFPDFKI